MPECTSRMPRCRGSLRGPIAAAAATVVVSLIAAGCDRASSAPPDLAANRDGAHPLYGRASDEANLGWTVFLRYCAGCHGDKGDGKGPAAKFLFPSPRDFTRGLYKFVSRPSGSLPTDDDLYRTITYGLYPSAMPAFPLLPDTEKRAVIRVLKAFYKNWNALPPAPVVTFYANPWDMDTEFSDDLQKAVKLGEEYYHGKAECWKCHPVYVEGARLQEIAKKYDIIIDRPNPHQPVLREDQWGQMIPPPDFKTMKLKSVRNERDLYRVIAAGVGGTAMPTWVDSLNAKELWALVFYVQSLIDEGRQARDAALKSGN